MRPLHGWPTCLHRQQSQQIIRMAFILCKLQHVRFQSNWRLRLMCIAKLQSGTFSNEVVIRNNRRKLSAHCSGSGKPIVISTSRIVLGVQNTNYSSDPKECVNRECLPTEATGTATSKTTTSGPIVHETTIKSESKISVSKEAEKMTSISAQTQTRSKRNNDDYKLPTQILPQAYDLYLCPDLETKKFTGKVTIDVDVIEPIDTVKMHSSGLNIEMVEIDFCRTTTYYLDPDHELLIIKLHDTLPIGETVIDIKFSGMMSGIVGLYYSTYEDEKKEIRRMATTKFEPTYARQAFPCFDEPSMKAAFTVHLLKPTDRTYIALSNMPQVDTIDFDYGTMVCFQASVKMSTYLTCFIVCDFEYTKETILGKIPFRVYAAPNQITKTDYAKNVGKKVIEFYVNYFGIEYPLPKLDMVAIPDFVSGAMEHWGLVTFRETALLYSEEISSSANKQRVATVIAHELAHSWFGNLVTMAWWNDLWLNEGFASYIEYKGVDFAEPDWHMMDQFIVSDLHPVLVLDSTLGSHPIVQTVLTPDQITEIFDTISYNKGAAILRMLEDAVGADNFKAGVTAYLEAHKFDNAVTQDLWNELQTIVGDMLNVTEFMNAWTVQMGYPIITVKSTAGNYVLSQKRFLTDSSKESTVQSPYNYRWNIPVTYITSDNPKATTVWFTHSDEVVTIPIPSAKWVKFNYNQVGYYRVNYEESYWRTLIEHIGEMSVSDKVHLLEETFRIAESGELSYDIPLDLTKYLVNEIGDYNYLPWDVASTMLTNIKLYIQNSEYYERYKKYVIDLVSPAYEKLTWTENKDDSHIKRRARVVVLDLACAMGHEECLLRAGELFNEYLNGVSVSQDLRTLVYKYGVQASSNEKWDLLWEKFVREQYASEKQNLMTGLTYSTEATVLRKLIEFAKDETFIRNQDYFTCIQQVAANSVGTPIVWDYVRKNWDALVARFGLNERYMGRMIPSITKTFTTQSQLEEMQEFFGKYPHAGAGASARVQALETVQNNIKWLARYKEDIEKWIKNNTS